jgi:two-component system, LytTR family, sensor kinase
MLLLPFVENAFKHSVNSINDTVLIDIELVIQLNELFFTVRNSISKNKESLKSGTGLDNIKKRLGLLYPEKYQLSFEETTETYFAKLWIQL